MRRNGFFLFYTVVVISVILLLAVAVFWGLKRVSYYEQKAECLEDEMFLVQEVLEVSKYNHVFHESESYPLGEVVRNGRTYEVLLESSDIIVEGTPLKELICTATAVDGTTFSATLWLGENQ